MGNLTYALSFGDSHCGLRFGLYDGKTPLHDEGPHGELVERIVTPTATQAFLWKLWGEGLQAVADLTAGYPLVALHGGDLCHGDAHPSQLMTTRLSDQVMVAADVLRSLATLSNLRAVRLVSGTEAHNSGEGSLENIVAELVKDDLPDVKIAMHWRLGIDGAVFDVAHHGPGVGSRAWLSGSQLGWYIRNIAMSEAMAGATPPDAVLRFHFHAYARATHHWNAQGHRGTTVGVVHPALCGINYFGVKATKSTPTSDYGMLLWRIEDGRVELDDRLVFSLDHRTREDVEVVL